MSDQLTATRINIREIPIGPMPGFGRSIPRCIVNIVIPKTPLDTEHLVSISQDQRDRVLSFGKHYCALAFHFWHDRAKIGREEAVAVVDYAPGGKWENAIEARIGCYSGFAFRVVANRTRGE